MAILRAREENTSAGATPTIPRKSSAEPSGLTTGKSALNASPKYLRTISIFRVVTAGQQFAEKLGFISGVAVSYQGIAVS
jgi:hypothetical protein